MAKKEDAANGAANVDDLLDGADAPAAKEKGGKAAKKAGAKAKAEKPAAKAAGKKAAAKTGGKAKAEKPAAKERAPRTPRADSLVPQIQAALGKVKKQATYEEIAEKTGADIRAVRRTARGMRDAGSIALVKEGQKVYISPAL